MKMKTIGCMVVALLLSSVAYADEEVQPQLFDDLNSNTVSDKQEETAPSHQPSAPVIEEIILPDTPPEEPTVAPVS